MTVTEEITALAQSIYLTMYNRYNDVTGAELTSFLDKTIDWVNQFTQELELEADWNYLRTNDNLIATIYDPATQSYDLPEEVRTVVYSPYRDVTISFDGAIVSTFTLVSPSNIADPTNPETQDRATVINRKLVLSRPLTATEVGGELRCDTIDFMPKLTTEDAELLSLVQPQQLIVLGVAKNSTLPDIVQGGISPSLAQKYNDLLKKAVMLNNETATAVDAPREDLSFIRGVY
jgi:hypothetical protein